MNGRLMFHAERKQIAGSGHEEGDWKLHGLTRQQDTTGVQNLFAFLLC